MAEPNDYITATRKNFVTNDNEGRMVDKCIIEIQGAFLVKIRDYTFNGNIRENAFKHIDKFLEVVGPIKINGWTQDRFRLSVFPISLAGAASEWFTKECIGSITTWDNVVEKFILKFHHLSDHDEEEETEEDDNPNETDNLINDKAKGTEEPWSESRVPYQLCDHICEPYRFKSGETKWPTCTSDIGGFCNSGKLPGMIRDETLALKAKIKGSWGDATLEVMKFCRWLKNSFENFHELDYDVLVKLQECWWKVNAQEIAPFTHMENFKRGPYANIKTEWASDPYLDVNRIFRRDYEACNFGDTQENQGHKEHKGNPNLEPSNCKIRRFEMMKYSFDDDEEYTTIKESEYHNHSKDSLDAYKELLCLIDERWVVTTPDDE
ncbi:hypothetical protein Tco_1477677 [Tanacetum coccineum]